jgi:uncharacterized protein (TIGR03437 family)
VLTPPVTTGSVAEPIGGAFAKLVTAISLTIDGQSAQIQYSGQFPGLISGILQIQAIVPSSVGSGPMPLVLTIGSATTSSQSITIFVA